MPTPVRSAFPLAAAVRRAAALVAVTTLPALAQSAPPSRETPPLVRRTLATNPLALPFGVVSGEYEQSVGTRGFAIGVGGLTTFTDDPEVLNDGGSDAFRSLQLKLKYYPAERGLRGFAIGLTAGVAHERSVASGWYVLDPRTGEVIESEEVTRSRTAPTLGATLDYNWLIGRRKRFLVGIGAGARRPFGDARGGPLGDPLFDGRLQIGVGF